MKDFDPTEHLSADDLEKILRLAAEIHRDLGFGELRRGFMASLHGVIEFDTAWASILHMGTGDLVLELVEGPADWLRDYDTFKFEDPLFRYFLEGKRGVVRMTDLIAPEDLWKTRLYRKIMKPNGIAWSMVLGTDLLPGIGCGFSLRRTLGRPDFSDRDKAVLVALRPRIETALRNALTYAKLDKAAALLTELFRREDRGLVVADTDGTVRLINLRASSLLGPLPSEGSGEHGPSLMRLPEELRSVIASVDGTARGERVRLGSGLSLVLRVEPQETTEGERLFLIEIEEDAAEGGRQALKSRGLSCREIEVAELVALGRSNGEIGRALYISEETVKVHLKRIFNKIGIKTRTALIAKWHEGSRFFSERA